MLKVGDKLLCKINMTGVILRKNEYYNIVKGKYYVISCKIAEKYKLNPNSYWYLWNHFYTPKEIRKMKLKQLNDAESR